MLNTIQHYLSMGCDKVTAEYFAAGRKKIVGVVPNDDYTLTLTFDNGERRIYDVKPLIKDNTVFAPLKLMQNFNRVYLDENACAAWNIDPVIDSRAIWSNKIDLCADSCYMNSVPAEK